MRNVTSQIKNMNDVAVDSEMAYSWGNFADSTFVLTLYGIICTIGITGNLLAVFVLLRVPSLRTNTSDFLVHLSLVDFLVCVLVIPFKLVPTTGTPAPNPGFMGELRCRFYVSQYIFWVCSLTSIYGLVAVNLERFVAIVYPLRYKVMFTRRNKYLMIASCWIAAALEQSFSIFLYGEDKEIGCKFLDWPSPGIRMAVLVTSFFCFSTVPFVSMFLMQMKVISTLRRQVKALKNRMASFARNAADQREMWQLRTSRKLSKTLLTFVITFAVCWAPNTIYYSLYVVGVHEDFSNPIYHISVILGIGNSCVNPISYIMTNKEFRRGIRDAFRRGRDSARVGNEVTGDVVIGSVSFSVAASTI